MTTLEFVGNYPSDAVPSQLAWREHLDIGPRKFVQNLRGFAVWYTSGRVIGEQTANYINGVLQDPQNVTWQGTNWVRPFSVPEAMIKPAVQRIVGAPQGTGDQNSLQPFLGGTTPDYIKQDLSFVGTSGTWNWTAPLGYLPPARPIGVRWYNDTVRLRHDAWSPMPALGSTLFGDPAYAISTITVTLVADIVCSLRPVLVSIQTTAPLTTYNASRYDQIGPNLWRATWQSSGVGSRAWLADTVLSITPAVGDTLGTVDVYRSFRTTRPPITGFMEVEPVTGPAGMDATATVTMFAGAIAPLTYDWDVPGADDPTDNDNPHDMEFNTEGIWQVLVTVTDASLRWTQFSQDVVVATGPPVALLESAGEAGSATSVRVSALPRLESEAMMGSLRLTPTLAQAPAEEEDRSWLTRPRVEEE